MLELNAAPPADDLIKDVGERDFMAEVVEASMQTPVIAFDSDARSTGRSASIPRPKATTSCPSLRSASAPRVRQNRCSG